jgi:hypothetical protein
MNDTQQKRKVRMSGRLKGRSHLKTPPTATFSFAADSRLVTLSSICEA